jgi:hypothetical protein
MCFAALEMDRGSAFDDGFRGEAKGCGCMMNSKPRKKIRYRSLIRLGTVHDFGFCLDVHLCVLGGEIDVVNVC